MKVNLSGSGVVAVAGVAALAGLGLLIYSKRGNIAAAAGAVVDAVNPASSDNLVYRGVSAAVVPAGSGDTLGTWLYGLKAKYFPSEADEAAAAITNPSRVPPPVDSTIMDRWDYYATSGRRASTGSGSEPERDWSMLSDLGAP